MRVRSNSRPEAVADALQSRVQAAAMPFRPLHPELAPLASTQRRDAHCVDRRAGRYPRSAARARNEPRPNRLRRGLLADAAHAATLLGSRRRAIRVRRGHRWYPRMRSRRAGETWRSRLSPRPRSRTTGRPTRATPRCPHGSLAPLHRGRAAPSASMSRPPRACPTRSTELQPVLASEARASSDKRAACQVRVGRLHATAGMAEGIAEVSVQLLRAHDGFGEQLDCLSEQRGRAVECRASAAAACPACSAASPARLPSPAPA